MNKYVRRRGHHPQGCWYVWLLSRRLVHNNAWSNRFHCLSSFSSIRSAGDSVPNQLRLLLAVLTRVGREGIQYGLSANPWAEPPEVVVTAGIAAVIEYFDDLYSSPSKVRRNSVKIVLVGQEGAGETR